MAMAGDSIMGIARDLAAPLLSNLSTSGSVEVYGQRVGRFYRAILREVELGRSETLMSRGSSLQYNVAESEEYSPGGN